MINFEHVLRARRILQKEGFVSLARKSVRSLPQSGRL